MASIAEPGQPAAAEQVSILDLPVDPSTPLFRVRPFRQLFITRVASTTAVQMLAVAVGWHVYELTDSALHLGMIGLVQVLPPVVLMLVIGQVADRINRRLVLRWCYVFAVLSSVRAGRRVDAAASRASLRSMRCCWRTRPRGCSSSRSCRRCCQ